MSSDIITSLQLNKDTDINKIIIVKEINGSDSSFLISCVLGYCIREKRPLILVSIHNSFSHYQNVGLKLNYSLEKSTDTGLISFVDLGIEFTNSLLENQPISLDSVSEKLKSNISEMQDKYGKVNLILDGLSHLFDLECKLKDVNKFCNDIISSVQTCGKSFVMCTCNVACDTDPSYILSNLLSHKAFSVLEVSSLASGLSADVSGHLTVKHPGQKFLDEHMFVQRAAPIQYLFKLFDRGVKLFAPGTV